MLVIKEVKTKKEVKAFVEFPLNLYKNNAYFVPPLYGDEVKVIKNPKIYECDSVYYLCYKDNKVVGRISGIIQHSSNNKWNQKRIRFTRFDSIDDQEVANLLFSTVEAWAKERNVEEIVGPLGFSDLEREGLLIEGFDELSTFEEQYNYPYYQKLIENYGFVKEVDWLESQIIPPAEIDERYTRISEHILKKYNLHYTNCKNIREFIKRYADQFFTLLDETYSQLYGTVPLTEQMKKEILVQFKLLLSLKYISTVVDENDKLVAFGIILPSISKAVQNSGGRLTIPTILRILKSARNPEILDLALIGVTEEYRAKGVISAIFYPMMLMMKSGQVKYCETNLNLENNTNILNQWKNFESIQHKRRRSFIKKIN